MSDEHVSPDGTVRRLGCNLPAAFPTGFRVMADAPAVTVLKLDQIRNWLAGRSSLYHRRQIFGPDWISDQHSTSACNGHSVARALSKTMFLRSGQKVLLSGADAYSQMNGGRDDGSTLADGIRVVQTGGIAREELVPWNKIFASQISAEAKADRANHRGFELFAVDSEEEFATGIVLGFVGVVAVHVTGSFDAVDGNGISRGGNGPGNHSVHVDDIGMLTDGTLVYDMPNSWSAEWCQQGRTKLTWARHLRECVKYHRFFLQGAALDDPQGNNPPIASD